MPYRAPTINIDTGRLEQMEDLSTGSLPLIPSGALANAWPVGAVYISVVNTNPATLFGFGTWVTFGSGRVLVGFDATQTEFDTAEETGGAKTVTPSGTNSGGAVSAHAGTAVADHVSHTHTYTDVPNHVHVEQLQGGTTGATTGTHIMASTATGGNLRSAGQSTLNPTGGVATGTTAGPSAILTHSVTQPNNHTFTQPTFAGNAHTNLAPYITVFFFKRTA